MIRIVLLIPVLLLLHIQYACSQSGGINYTSTSATNVSFNEMIIDPSGWLYTIGSKQPSAGPSETYITKGNSFGSSSWDKVLRDSACSRTGQGIAADNNSVYICGHAVEDSGAAEYGYISRLDNNANPIWEKRIDYMTSIQIKDIQIDGSGGCVAVGTGYTMGSQAGLLIRIDSSGSVLWARTFIDTSGQDISMNGVAVNAAGDFYVAGTIVNLNNRKKASLHKFQNNGLVLWSKVYTDSLPELTFESIIISGSSLILCGSYRNSPSDNSTGLVARLDSAGNFSASRYIGSSNNPVNLNSVAVSSPGTFVLTGYAGINNSSFGVIIEVASNFSFVRALQHDNCGFNSYLMHAGSCCLAGNASGANTQVYHGYSNYAWEWGCGFHSYATQTSVFNLNWVPYNLTSVGMVLIPGTTVVDYGVVPIDPCYNLVGLTESTGDTKISVSPNPVSDKCVITFPASNNGTSALEVIDHTGKIVRVCQVEPGQQTLELDLSDLPAGIYFLKSEDGFAAKIVVAH